MLHVPSPSLVKPHDKKTCVPDQQVWSNQVLSHNLVTLTPAYQVQAEFVRPAPICARPDRVGQRVCDSPKHQGHTGCHFHDDLKSARSGIVATLKRLNVPRPSSRYDPAPYPSIIACFSANFSSSQAAGRQPSANSYKSKLPTVGNAFKATTSIGVADCPHHTAIHFDEGP
jgi:hypothetical protein